MTNNNLPVKFKVDNETDWMSCRVFHNGYGQNHYIRIVSDQMSVTLYGHHKELSKVLSNLLLLVDPATDQPGLRHQVDTVANITPAEVISYFRNSPILAPLADDVEAVLKPLADIGRQSDFDTIKSKLPNWTALIDQGQPARGAQAEIARALNIPNAGSYRNRILAVLEQIIKSTTTPEKPETAKVA